MIRLKISDIKVSYGSIEALHGVSLEVSKGEIVSLLGANGAGKTTTLMTVSGILRVRSGQIEMDGENVTNLSPRQIVQRGIVQVPEGRRIFPRLTVLENLKMGALNSGNTSKIPESLERVYFLFPLLAERAKQLGGTLSGGEQQMLAIGRGMMSKPRILLLDEPSLGLAPKLTKQIFGIVRTVREQGTTVLLVEQNARAALAIADRGYILTTGRIYLEGTSEELKNSPEIQKAYLGG